MRVNSVRHTVQIKFVPVAQHYLPERGKRLLQTRCVPSCAFFPKNIGPRAALLMFSIVISRARCAATRPLADPPGLLGHWTSRLQDYSATNLNRLYSISTSYLRAKCCQISVKYRSGRQDLNLRTLLSQRDRTTDADDVFDRFPARSCLTGAADMILVPINTTQATTPHIRGRNIEDENGPGHRQGNTPIVGAGHCCRATADRWSRSAS